MRPDKKVLAAGVAAACVWMGTNAYAAGSHTISVNATVTAVCRFVTSSSSIPLTIDPTQSTTVTATDLVPYQCSSGTTPAFTLASSSTDSATGGNLLNGANTLAYAFSSSGAAAGTGFTSTQSLTVTVSVGQAQAASVPAGTYSDTVLVSVNP